MFVCRCEEKMVVINEIAGLGGFFKAPLGLKGKKEYKATQGQRGGG
jgi:hypothetical protein